MKENIIATNFDPNIYAISVQSTKIGTHENKVRQSSTVSLRMLRKKAILGEENVRVKIHNQLMCANLPESKNLLCVKDMYTTHVQVDP